MTGDREDQPIARDDEVAHLTVDEHFYSDKVMTILVNGDEHQVEVKEIAYIQVVELYLGSGGQGSNEYLVKYSHGSAQYPSGTLAPGQKVKIKNDMRFRVAGTGES